MKAKHPFDGVKVLDLAGFIAGGYCSSLLADMGAQVVKLESHEGDPFRALLGAFQGWNRGKRGIVVNLRTQEGRGILERLARRSDVVVENFRSGVAERLGADYESLRRLNPALIYCSVAGYGREGPYADRPAFDPIMQARSGAMAAQGGPGQDPVFLKVAVSDYSAALLAAWGVAMALYARARTGQGQRVDISLLNAGIAIQSADFLQYPGQAPPRARPSPLGPSALRRLYRTKDGWVFLDGGAEDSWAGLCRALLGEAARDPRFARAADREQHDAELTALLEGVMAGLTSAECLALLEREKVPCGRVNYLRDIAAHPQVRHQRLTVRQRSGDLGWVSQVGLTVKLFRTPGRLGGGAPRLGQHTDQVLRELGYTASEVALLREKRVVA